MDTSLPDTAPRTPETDDHVEGPARPRKARRGLRRLGTALIVVGCLSLAYGATVYFWKDPVTDLWATWKQRGLSSELEQSFAEFEPTQVAEVETQPAAPAVEPAPEEAEPSTSPEPSAPVAPADTTVGVEVVVADARRFAASIEEGDAIGQLVIPRLDIDPIVVNGTDWGRDLSQGPGLYPESVLPGAGQVSAIAGHRTTFGAWFRNIDDLEGGDAIDLVMPYGTFHYEVVEHEIVDNGDWSILEPRGYRMLVLSACHPLYSASQRWIVYARLVSVDRPDGTTVRIST